MRYSEIVTELTVAGTIPTTKPKKPIAPSSKSSGGIAPLDPAAARKRASKVEAATAKVADVTASANIKIAAARRAASEV